MPRKKKQVTPEVFERRKKVERYIRNGVTNRNQMAAALGVSRDTIDADVKAVYKEWIRAQPKTVKYLIGRQVARLDGLLQEAMNGWGRSQRDTEQLHLETVLCPVCLGQKSTPLNGDCTRCEGKGTVVEQKAVITGKAGDPAFLKTALECVKEMSRLQGLYPEKKSSVEVGGLVGHIGVAATPGGGPNPYSHLSPEKLIEARMVLQNLLAPPRGEEGLVVEGKKVEG